MDPITQTALRLMYCPVEVSICLARFNVGFATGIDQVDLLCCSAMLDCFACVAQGSTHWEDEETFTCRH